MLILYNSQKHFICRGLNPLRSFSNISCPTIIKIKPRLCFIAISMTSEEYYRKSTGFLTSFSSVIKLALEGFSRIHISCSYHAPPCRLFRKLRIFTISTLYRIKILQTFAIIAFRFITSYPIYITTISMNSLSAGIQYFRFSSFKGCFKLFVKTNHDLMSVCCKTYLQYI